MRLLPLAVTAALLTLTTACGTNQDNAASDLLSAGTATVCPNIPWQNPGLGTLDAGVRNFAAGHLGQRVGSGECSDLADFALRSVGAKTFSQLGPTGVNADYVWGSLVSVLSTSRRTAAGILPGDVIQYRNFSQKVTNPDGSWWTSNAFHHTSVVKGVSTDGRSLCVYEQNVGGRRTVGTGYVNLSALQTGTLSVYRPRQ